MRAGPSRLLAVLTGLWAPTVAWCAPPSAAAPGQELCYRWEAGRVRQCQVKITGTGQVRSPEGLQPFRLQGTMHATERVTKVGPGGVATLETTWDQADFEIYGQKGSLAPGVARTERMITPWGTEQSFRTFGRPQAATQGKGFLVDVDQLALLDLLVEQVQWPLFPREPVEENQTWRMEERLPEEGMDGSQTRDTTLVKLSSAANEVTAELKTEVNASVSFGLEGLGGLNGKAQGRAQQFFACRRGELDRATGTFQMELLATLPAEPAPDDGPAEAAPPLGLSAEFTIEVSYQNPPDRK